VIAGRSALSPDGALVSTAGDIVTTDTGRVFSESVAIERVAALAFSPDGRRLATLDDETLVVREARSLLELACAQLRHSTNAYTKVAAICEQGG